MSKIQSESNSQHWSDNKSTMVCCDRYVKDTIWKQFTTHARQWCYPVQLWSVCQRYNLKAIHNSLTQHLKTLLVVIGMSKIQSESNSQPASHRSSNTIGCDRYVKDTIWKQFTTQIIGWIGNNKLWSVCQRYNLKAIHNCRVQRNGKTTVVIGMSKIQSESNSQPPPTWALHKFCCDRYVKDTIWKQFTTICANETVSISLWSVCQRYNLKAIHNNKL